MANPRFRNALFYESRPPMTLEDTIRFCGALAGVHRWDFNNTIYEDFTDLANWTVDPGAAASVAGGSLTLTAGPAVGTWYQMRHAVQCVPGFIARFDIIYPSEGGLVFHGKTDASAKKALIAWWDASSGGIGYIDDVGTKTDIVSFPFGGEGPAKFELAVWERLDSVDLTLKWVLVCMYRDGWQMMGAAIQLPLISYDYLEEYIGLAVVGNGGTLHCDNVQIQELKRVVEYVSVDPGETPSQGMGRAIDNTRVRFICRYDGTVRAWRPGDRAVAWTVPQERLGQISRRKDRSQTATHIRLVGAANMVDRFDDDEGVHHMHRFRYVDDPNMLTDRNAYTEAGYQLNEAKEQQDTIRATLAFQPLIEPQDVISLDGVSRRVTSIGHDLTMTEQGPRSVTTIEAQKYEVLP